MVQFRGINIHVVSQVDAKRLPEHSTARAFDAHGTFVACYIPIYPGAQIWLEYSIDGPHPPDAAYFFKMLINNSVVSSWDCTAKHDYHGKATYILSTVSSHPLNEKVVLQKSLAFAGLCGSHPPSLKDDSIEIRIHRIEHRRRLRDLPLDALPAQHSSRLSALRIVDGGPIDFVRSARRYQYQLVDPQDEPYATFRFYCRTQDYLNKHRILNVDASLSPTSLATSISDYFDATSSPTNQKQEARTLIRRSIPATPMRSPPRESGRTNLTNAEFRSPQSPKSPGSPNKRYLPRESSRLSVKDSIEDLPSAVPRSPQSPKRHTFEIQQQGKTDSPTQASSPLLPEALQIRKRPMTKPALNASSIPTLSASSNPPTRSMLYDDSPPQPPPRLVQLRPSTSSPRLNIRPPHKLTDFDLMLDGITTTEDLNPGRRRCESSQEHRTHRPLSPFTPGGLLRRLTSTPIFSAKPAHAATGAARTTQIDPRTLTDIDYCYPNRDRTYSVEVSGARGEDWTPIKQRRSGRALWSNFLGRGASMRRNVTA